MKIGVGLHLLAPDNGGVTNYVLSLLRLWPVHIPEHPLVLFSFPHNDVLLSTLAPATRRHEIRLSRQEDAFDHADEIDVYFCPFGTLWPRPFPKPTVLTFHDMQERFFPEHFTDAELAERFFHYDWSLRMADGVIAVSAFTRAMAVSLAGIPSAKCQVVHHVPDELPSPMQPPGLPSAFPPFVFYPANMWAHKNHGRLLAAFGKVCGRSQDLRLVCTGSLLGRESQWTEDLKRNGIADRVVHLGKVSRPEISWLYRNARALIFPSMFEGFGIPLIEAMSAGCPIACAGNTSQPEVAGDAALYFDAESTESICAAVLRIHADEALRTELVGRGNRLIARFSADRFTQGHLNAFRSAVCRHSAAQAWLNRNVRLPRSLQPRTQLSTREKRTAAELLSRHAALPANAIRASS